MAPKSADPSVLEDGPVDLSNLSNNELIEDPAKVHLDPAMGRGRGIINDIKRTVGTHWKEEMVNLNQKTIAVSLLMFITVISPTLTFGAVYGKMTENRIGAIETILATAWVGVTYALIGGMPTCIIGSTGPVLAYATVIYNLSKQLDIPYYTFNGWISIWLLGYVLLCTFFDGTRFIRLCTRFTDEIFALLIVSIFLMDAIGDPFSQVGLLRFLSPNHPSHAKYEDDPDYEYMTTGLLSVILGFGTTATIFFFRGFRTSPYFCNQSIRNSLFDFAVTLSVLAWTLVKHLIFEDIPTETLKVPDKFEPSFVCCDSSCLTGYPDECPDQAEPWGRRPWIANITEFNGKGWVPFAAAGPAILAFVLCYLDNGITWHLVYHPANKVTHGEAYNYDLILNASFNCINGILGCPWLVATTVPCLIHLNALAEKDKDSKIIRVQETRLTMLFSHMLVGMSLLFLNVLKLLPLPVLLGVFLFMALASLPGIQLWQRTLMFFKQPDLYPETPYTKYVAKSRQHKYTLLELCFFGLVVYVQNTPKLAIIFPLMVLICIPSRLFLLPKLFEGWEILLLDGDDDTIAAWLEAKKAQEQGRMYVRKSTKSLHTGHGGTSVKQIIAEPGYSEDEGDVA